MTGSFSNAASTSTAIRRPDARLRRVALGAAGLLLAAAAQAQDFASVFTSAQAYHGSTATELSGCASTIAAGAMAAATSASCDGGSRSPSAAITVSAHSTAPTAPDQLAELGTSARIVVDTRSGSGDALGADFLSSSAGAAFRDYVIIGAERPAEMVFTFQLTGTLAALNPAFYPSADAGTILNFAAQAGNYSNGSFGSTTPFSLGQSQVTTKQDNLGTTTTRFDDPGNAADFHLAFDATGHYTLTLGSSFFANPDHTHVFIGFDLASFAELTYAWPFAGSTLTAESDYSHTLRMTSVSAFDAAGEDITASAFGGFASNGDAGPPPTSPVPEPETVALLLAGLAMLAARGRRALRRAAAAAPA